MKFVHLHTHSEYSLLDGAIRIKELVKNAVEAQSGAVALTDHGVMNGVIEFYKQATENHIKPIIGCEVYTAPRTRFDKQHGLDSKYGHLILLCKNNIGYENLMEIVSKSHIEGFYIKPRVDIELLTACSDGLIALSGCIMGDIPSKILSGNMAEAIEIAKTYKKIFKENFYLELQNHNLKEQLIANTGLIEISKKLSIPVVATNDAHYVSRDNAKAQQILMCIQTGKTIFEGTGFDFSSNEFYLKSAEEMQNIFKSIPEAIESTIRIADSCNVTIELGKIQLPKFEQSIEKDNFTLLKNLVNEGLKNKYNSISSELNDRVTYELNTIKSMGFVDYFLIVYDYVKFANENNIPVGPGRGSAAGSIVSFCLNITDVDPLEYDLLFERFLNPERITMPDIDIDFCYERRQEVIDYVISKYGKDRVAQIITFGTLMAKQVIRDVARATGVSYADADKVAKLIPFQIGITIKRALETEKNLAQLYNENNKIKELLDYSMQLEGLARHASTHAAGVVITANQVSKYVPLQKNDEAIVTQYPMNNLEDLGLLKMDFLGLRYLTVIADTEKAIKAEDKTFNTKNILFKDKKTFGLLSAGKTLGVFQMESAGLRQLLTSLIPTSMEDIIAAISLYRPGPMKSIPTYLENRHNRENIKYKHPMLEDILNVTYGCIVYQEQVMKIVRKLAGYSLGRADLVRRAMSKKKQSVMQMEKKNFVYGQKDENGNIIIKGAINNGVDEQTAISIFDEITTFAEYAFNKSHAAAYAVLAYKTAYLKAHYPKQYMASLLSSVLGSAEKVSEYTQECEKLGIKVLPPCINESIDGFNTSDKNIRFGLVAIKNVGKGFIKRLIIERNNNGRFKSFVDFCKRMSDYDLNKRCIEALIKCGCFDTLGVNRKVLLTSYEDILEQISIDKRKNIEGQVNLFEQKNNNEKQFKITETFSNMPEFPKFQLLQMEKEMSGIYFSGHPMSIYEEKTKQINATPVKEIITSFEDYQYKFNDNQPIITAGIISSIVIKTTKNNQKIAFITLEDIGGSIECVVFSNLYDNISNILKEGVAVYVTGKISVKEEENPKIIASLIQNLEDVRINKPKTLYLKFEKEDNIFFNITNYLKTKPGDNEVVFVIKNPNKKLKANFKVCLNEEIIKYIETIIKKENIALN